MNQNSSYESKPKIKGFRELKVWQKAMDLVTEVYRLAKLLPREETYALSDQLRRAVVSVPSNIAEGNGRFSAKEYISYLSIANGSRAEVETQLEVCVRIGYLKEEEIQKAMEMSEETGKMIGALIRKLKEKN